MTAPATEYVVCPACGSHRLLAREWLVELWELTDGEPILLFFICDRDGCDEGFDALVAAPAPTEVPGA